MSVMFKFNGYDYDYPIKYSNNNNVKFVCFIKRMYLICF